MTAESVLAAMTARAEAATPGPWHTQRRETYVNVWADDDFDEVAVCEFRPEFHKNAAFIAAARTDVPRLVATLRAVLALHVYKFADGTILDECPVCVDEMLEAVPYPCATVRAITAALEES